MARVLLSLGLVVLAACRTRGDSESDVACETTVLPYPSPSEQDVYYRTTVEAELVPQLDRTATIEVVGIRGSSEWRDDTLVFTPSEPLHPLTEYTAIARFACAPEGGARWTFTTSDVGPPVDPSMVTGRAYAFDLASGRLVEPAGKGSLLQAYLTSRVLVGVAATADTVEIITTFALDERGADPVVQDTCLPTMSFAPKSFGENPFVDAGPAPWTTSWTGSGLESSVPFSNVRLEGSFAPDASYVAGGVLAGEIDAKSEGNVACEWIESCGPCSDGSGNTCVALRVDGIHAAAMAEPLQVIPSQDAACLRPECADHPACAP